MALVAMALLISSCDNKSVGCNGILEITRKAELVIDTARTGKREELMNIAKGLDQLATELERLNVTDDKLQVYRNGFVKSYRDIGQALRSTVAAIDRPNSNTVSNSLSSLERATSRNQSLVEEMRTICPN